LNLFYKAWRYVCDTLSSFGRVPYPAISRVRLTAQMREFQDHKRCDCWHEPEQPQAMPAKDKLLERLDHDGRDFSFEGATAREAGAEIRSLRQQQKDVLAACNSPSSHKGKGRLSLALEIRAILEGEKPDA
jgi:hypothetical protein